MATADRDTPFFHAKRGAILAVELDFTGLFPENSVLEIDRVASNDEVVEYTQGYFAGPLAVVSLRAMKEGESLVAVWAKSPLHKDCLECRVLVEA